MTMSHDYAGCAVEPCVRCHDYGLGWAHGKMKMRDEIVAAATLVNSPLFMRSRMSGRSRAIRAVR